MRKTFIGRGTPRANGGTEHTTRPNLMSVHAPNGRLAEATRLKLQADLRTLLRSDMTEDDRFIEEVTVNVGGDVYLDLYPCSAEQRAATIGVYLQALEALKLHDREQGVDNHTV